MAEPLASPDNAETLSGNERYYARSASDRTDEWPFWFVADRNKAGLNVTLSLVESLYGQHLVCLPFMSRDDAVELAIEANNG